MHNILAIIIYNIYVILSHYINTLSICGKLQLYVTKLAAYILVPTFLASSYLLYNHLQRIAFPFMYWTKMYINALLLYTQLKELNTLREIGSFQSLIANAFEYCSPDLVLHKPQIEYLRRRTSHLIYAKPWN